MQKGIRNKDIQNFEKYAAKLNAIIERIRAYAPEAYIYASPGELNLMAGVEDNKFATTLEASAKEREDFLVSSVKVTSLESGDW